MCDCSNVRACECVCAWLSISGPPPRVLLHINPSINQLLLTPAVWLHTAHREGGQRQRMWHCYVRHDYNSAHKSDGSFYPHVKVSRGSEYRTNHNMVLG